MPRKALLCLLFGLILVSVPLLRAAEDEYADGLDDGEGEEEEGDSSEYADGLDEPGGEAEDEDDEGDEYDDDLDDGAPAAGSNLPSLTHANFNKMIAQNKFVLVAFVSPSCGHCEEMLPHFEQAAATLAEHAKVQALLATVDVTKQAKLAKQFEVEEYPTIKWFVDGAFAGDFSKTISHAEDVVHWVERKAGPPVVAVDTMAELQEHLHFDHAIVGHFNEKTGDARDAFEKVSKQATSGIYVETRSKEVVKTLGLQAPPSFAIARMHPVLGLLTVNAEGNPHFAGADLEAQIMSFVSKERLPPYVHLTEATASDVFGSGLTTVVIVVAHESNLTIDSDLVAAIMEASPALRNRAIIATCETGSDFAGRMEEFFGFGTTAKAGSYVVLGLDIPVGSEPLKYVLKPAKTGKLTGAALGAWVESILDKSAKPMTAKKAKKTEAGGGGGGGSCSAGGGGGDGGGGGGGGGGSCSA